MKTLSTVEHHETYPSQCSKQNKTEEKDVKKSVRKDVNSAISM